jgi:hypothetical protein
VARRGPGQHNPKHNNLKQMGLAMHNFQDTYNKLPNGARDGDNRIPSALDACCRSNTQYGWSWSYQILPFIEMSTTHQLSSTSDDPTPVNMNNYDPKEDVVAGTAVWRQRTLEQRWLGRGHRPVWRCAVGQRNDLRASAYHR